MTSDAKLRRMLERLNEGAPVSEEELSRVRELLVSEEQVERHHIVVRSPYMGDTYSDRSMSELREMYEREVRDARYYVSRSRLYRDMSHANRVYEILSLREGIDEYKRLLSEGDTAGGARALLSFVGDYSRLLRFMRERSRVEVYYKLSFLLRLGHTEMVCYIMSHLGEFGMSWRDVYGFAEYIFMEYRDTEVMGYIYELVRKQIMSDYENVVAKRGEVSLCAKWFPRYRGRANILRRSFVDYILTGDVGGYRLDWSRMTDEELEPYRRRYNYEDMSWRRRVSAICDYLQLPQQLMTAHKPIKETSPHLTRKFVNKCRGALLRRGVDINAVRVRRPIVAKRESALGAVMAMSI